MSQKNACLRALISRTEARMRDLADTTIGSQRTPPEYAERVGAYKEMKYQLGQLQGALSEEVDEEPEEASVPAAPDDKLTKRRTRNRPRSWGG